VNLSRGFVANFSAKSRAAESARWMMETNTLSGSTPIFIKINDYVIIVFLKTSLIADIVIFVSRCPKIELSTVMKKHVSSQVQEISKAGIINCAFIIGITDGKHFYSYGKTAIFC